MAEDPDKSGGEPNLELPSLFGRGRKKKRREAAQNSPVVRAEGQVADSAEAPATTTEGSAQPGPAPVVGSTRRLPPTPPPTAREHATEDTAPIRASTPPAEPDVEPVPSPTPAPRVPEPMPEPPTPEPTPIPPTPEPTPEPMPVPPEPEPSPVATEPWAEAAAVEETSILPGPASTEEPAEASGSEPVGAPLFADEEPGRRRAPRERTPLTLPRINPWFAAAVTGLVVGLVGVLLSYGASRGCEAVRGVGSCGGIGLFALLAIVMIQVLLGGVLLRAFGLTDPTSTSFLAVGLVAVLALLFFLGSLESVWMLLVIPVLTAITFLISWWVTETFIEQGADDNLHR